MASSLAVLQETAEQLSPQHQNELIDFAEFLLSKERVHPRAEFLAGVQPASNAEQEERTWPTRRLTFDWCAGPDEPPVAMTSVEMQHEALEWIAQKAEENLTKR